MEPVYEEHKEDCTRNPCDEDCMNDCLDQIDNDKIDKFLYCDAEKCEEAANDASSSSSSDDDSDDVDELATQAEKILRKEDKNDRKTKVYSCTH